MRAIGALVLGYVLAAPAAVEAQTSKWSGFYAGFNAGTSWADLDQSRSFLSTGGSVFGITPGPTAIYPAADSTSSMRSWLGGVQAGYNLQFGALVLGVEADYQRTGAERSSQLIGSALGPTYNVSAEVKYFGTVRARLGYAFDRTLIYATGGLAYGEGGGDISIKPGTPSMIVPGGPYSGGDTQTHVGYALGGGLEYALTSNISFKAEYLYADLGSKTYTFNLPSTADGSFVKADEAITMQAVRAGLNFRF